MIGILGGTFDPIHLGHTHIAGQVQTQLGLHGVQFMPCALPVHRGVPRASAAQRCAMIELAISATPTFTLNTIELQRDEPSYTVDSLRRLRQGREAGDSDAIVLILGGDAFNGFADWKSPGQILEMAHLAVCCRPGTEIDDRLFAEHRVSSPEELRERDAGAILPLAVEPVDCSASQVREALLKGDAAHRFLDPAVADYIDEHQLYRNLT